MKANNISKKLEKLSTSKKIYGVKSPKSPKFGNRKKSSDDDVFMNRHNSNTSEGSSIGIVMNYNLWFRLKFGNSPSDPVDQIELKI